MNVFGRYYRYNGYLPPGDRGRRRSKFLLFKRPIPNGVKRSKHYIVKTPHSSQAILNTKQHSISYTLSRTQAVIVEYTEDEETDMFQVSFDEGEIKKETHIHIYLNKFVIFLFENKTTTKLITHRLVVHPNHRLILL